MQDDTTTYLTVKDIAKRMQVGEQAVRRWIKSGQLVAVDVMGQYRIHPSDFEEFIRKHKRQHD